MNIDHANVIDGASADLSDDAFLGGRLHLLQLKRGHRAGHDALLLAAFTAGGSGVRVADLGAGIGAAGLAFAAREQDVHVTLVEREDDLVRLARANIDRNGLAARVDAVHADLVSVAGDPENAGRFDGVMMNPPYNDAARHRASPDRLRAAAHVGFGDDLSVWIDAAARLLKPKGTLSLIWRADGLDKVLAALAPRFGAIEIRPVHSLGHRPAIRILVGAVLGSRAPLNLLPALTLQNEAGAQTQIAEAILRRGAPLPRE